MIRRTHLLLILAFVVANVALSAIFYPRLPNPCPIHWNIKGEVDDYGSPLTMALIAPCAALGLTLLLILLPSIGPLKRNLQDFRVIYGRIGVLLIAFFFALQVVMLLAAIGKPLRMGAILSVLFGVLSIFLGNWMGKVRRNFYIGIRTPWTLANEVVWEKTHRVGGRLFVAAGLITAVTGFFASDIVCFVVLMTTLLGTALWSVIYSLVIYRKLGQVDDLAPGSANTH